MKFWEIRGDSFLDENGKRKAWNVRTRIKAFQVFHFILQNTQIPYSLQASCLAMSFFQNCLFPFHPLFTKFWTNSFFTYFVKQFGKISSLFPYFIEYSYATQLFVVYFSLFLLLCILGSLIVLHYLFMSKSFKKNRTGLKKYARILGVILFLFVSVGHHIVLGIWLRFYLIGALFSQIDFSVDDNNNYVDTFHHDIQITSGSHVVHCGFVLFGLILGSCGFGFLLEIYFNSFLLNTNYGGKWSNEKAKLEFILKIIIFTEFSFLKSEWIISMTILVGNFLIYFHSIFPFFHHYVFHQIWRCTTLLQSMLGLIMLISYLIQHMEYKFNAGMELFTMLIPFIFFMRFQRFDERHKWLLQKKSNCQSQIHSLGKCFHFHFLANEVITNREMQTIFNGYCILHIPLCHNSRCSIKEYKFGFDTQVKKLLIKAKNLSAEERKKVTYTHLPDYTTLVHHTNYLLNESTLKFSDFTFLRIRYIQFLMQEFSNQNHAIDQMHFLQNKKLNLVESFLLFRYRNNIWEKLIKGNLIQGSSLKVKDIITYEKNSKLLKEKIEKCVTAQMHFWDILQENVIHFGNLKDNGFFINQMMVEIRRHFRKVRRIYPDDSSSNILYGSFLVKSVGDSITGKSILNRSKVLHYGENINKEKLFHSNLGDIQTYSTEGYPCICLSGTQNKEGIIKDCNASLCAFLGYPKEFLLGKSIDRLLPSILEGTHQIILQKSSRNLNSIKKCKEVNETFPILCTHSTGFLISCSLKIIAMPSLLNNNNFISLLKPIKKNHSEKIGFLVLDTNKIIKGITSSCMYIFGLTPRFIKIRKVHISTIIPDLETTENQWKYLGKNGSNTSCIIPKQGSFHELFSERPLYNLNSYQSNKNINQQIEKNIFRGGRQIHINCKMKQIEIGEQGMFGYLLRVEYIENRAISELNMDVISSNLSKSFQFSFNEQFHLFMREPPHHENYGMSKSSESPQIQLLQKHLYNISLTKGIIANVLSFSIKNQPKFNYKEIIEKAEKDSLKLFNTSRSYSSLAESHRTLNDLILDLKNMTKNSNYIRTILPRIKILHRITNEKAEFFTPQFLEMIVK